MSTNTSNPLVNYFRSTKLYTALPSQGKYYSPDVIVMPDNGELAVMAMTAKDELIMKNPDALLNGEAITQVLISCVPGIKKPKQMINSDVETLLVAIHAASYGETLEVRAVCPECKTNLELSANITVLLDQMELLEESYSVTTVSGLEIEVKPYLYSSAIKAGIAEFKSSRSLQSISNIQDEMEQLKTYNKNFMQIASLNFELLVESVFSISTPNEPPEVVFDRKSIQEFLENCDSSIGHDIEEKIAEINKKGFKNTMLATCTNEECKHEFDTSVNFNPVNFSIAS